jgi:uncharacterized Zn-finger protein
MTRADETKLPSGLGCGDITARKKPTEKACLLLSNQKVMNPHQRISTDEHNPSSTAYSMPAALRTELYKCGVCDKRLVWKTNMRRHMKTVHKKNEKVLYYCLSWVS